MPSLAYSKSVFINCPFDKPYSKLFDAIVFCVMNCGFFPRCALEPASSSPIRIDNISSLIEKCKFGVHDLSRTELDKKSKLPRFNMPFELGLFWGAKEFGTTRQKSKISIIMDSKKYRYQKFLSDLAGVDIKPHFNNETIAIREVRNWLYDNFKNNLIPGSQEINRRYNLYEKDLPEIVKVLKKGKKQDLTFNEKRDVIYEWMKINVL